MKLTHFWSHFVEAIFDKIILERRQFTRISLTCLHEFISIEKYFVTRLRGWLEKMTNYFIYEAILTGLGSKCAECKKNNKLFLDFFTISPFSPILTQPYLFSLILVPMLPKSLLWLVFIVEQKQTYRWNPEVIWNNGIESFVRFSIYIFL